MTKTTTVTERPARTIAIIGAGPGGLVCARILQRQGVAVTVYERDAAADSRDQGGTLDMQRETGQVALAHAGLLETFLATARPEGQDMRILDQSGHVHLERIAPDDERESPEMDRADLRNLLLNAVEPDTVRWGAGLLQARPLDQGRHRLTFTDGFETDVELVIGADGAWSKVRPLVSPATPAYEGVVFVEIRLADVDDRHPEIAALVGRGGMFAFGSNRALLAQRQSRGRIRTYAAFRDDLDWAVRDGVPLDDPAAVRAHLLSRFGGWSPELRRLLVECENLFLVRPMYALPVPHQWETRPGVSILGDAAHLMSPFSGLGANTAMLDGAELAQAILEHPDLTEAIAAYESVMLPRAARNAAGAHQGLQEAITDEPDFSGPPEFADDDLAQR